MGRGLIEAEAKEPEIIEPLGQHAHEFAFAGDVVVEEQEDQFEDDGRVERLVAIVAVEFVDFLTDEGEINGRFDGAQRVIVANALVEVDVVSEKIFLWVVGVSPS
jgi:6-phosphogluconate dehydrogenase (decarboxylating)